MSTKPDYALDQAVAVYKPFYRLSICGIWALALFVFSRPGRTIGSSVIDVIAFAKLAVCGSLMGLTVWHFSSCWRDARIQRVLYLLLPFGVFWVWSAISVLWSPAKTTTISQVISLATLLTLCFCTIVGGWSKENRVALFTQVCGALLLTNSIVMVVHMIRPTMSGLLRSETPIGADGIIHPTAAGANAAIGLLIALCGALICRYRSVILLAIPTVFACGVVLLFAASRTAVILVAFAIPFVFYFGANRREKGLLLITGAAIGMMVLLADPGFTAFESLIDKVEAFVWRGETKKQLATLNGRSDMWAAIWHEFEKSIWIGHGYFVTSEHGKFFIWDRTLNHTAHNLVLQILVSTGIVGTCMFTWALLKLVATAAIARMPSIESRRLRLCIFVIFGWYVGWSQLCISFMGPLRTESVVFFVLLGLLVSVYLGDINSEQTAGATP